MTSQLLSKACSPILIFVRHGHKIRGKAPGIAKTLQQRLAERNYEDPVLHSKHDIGFPPPRPSSFAEKKQRMDHLRAQRKNVDLEKLARTNKLQINLEEVKNDWSKTRGPFHIRKIAEHYGVFEHLFGRYAHFIPQVKLDIKFQLSDDLYCPVYYGNRLKSFDAKNAPEVTFDHTFSISPENEKKDSLWTLVLTNPDGHFKEENKEYVHWMIGNIPNGDISKGDLIVPYLQPFPPKGTGYHRHIFVLYKQEQKLDLSSLKVTEPANLEYRTFSTFDFYREHQDQITPAGLSFFQVNWDDSLTAFYHNILKMKEPIYDYDYPEAYLKDQKLFPHRMAFNLYLDRYSDPKEVNKRFIEQRLAKTHPFEGPEPPLRFPNAEPLGDKPEWLKLEIKKARLGIGRINDVENS